MCTTGIFPSSKACAENIVDNTLKCSTQVDSGHIEIFKEYSLVIYITLNNERWKPTNAQHTVHVVHSCMHTMTLQTQLMH